jgi:hypothetical protein
VSTNLGRVLVPLLAAPVALVCIATNAAAINVEPHTMNDNNTTTAAYCEHPSDHNIWFDAYIGTGDEYGPDANDVKGMYVEMVDRTALDYLYNAEAHASELKYTFGIFDNGNFVPTTSTFADGSKVKNGVFISTTKSADVQAVKFDATWRLLHPNRMRTVSCVIELDGPAESGG